MSDPAGTVVQTPAPKGYPIALPAAQRPVHMDALNVRVAETHPDTQDLVGRVGNLDDTEVTAALRRIANWPENEIAIRAYEIPGSLLDRLLRVFVGPVDSALRTRIDAILQARMKRRFCALVWQLLQEHCHDAALLSLLFSGAGERPSFRSGSNLKFLEFFRPEDRVSGLSLPERVYQGLATTKIDSYFDHCGIPREGNLAIEVLAQYFTARSKPDLQRESAAFSRMISVLRRPQANEALELHFSEVLAPALGHYLTELEPTEYDDDRMNDVLKRYGLPDTTMPLWSRLGEAQLKRFHQWIQLDQVREHLGGRRQKMRILGGLYPYIENVITDQESGLLFIYFNKFVLVDRKEEPAIMLLYPRKVFAETYDLFTRQRASYEESRRHAAEEAIRLAEEETEARNHPQLEIEEDEAEEVAEPVVAATQDAPPQLAADYVVPWPVNAEIITMARTAILETRTERDRRQTLAQTILRGTSDRIVHLRFEDTPILYARQFLYDLLG